MRNKNLRKARGVLVSATMKTLLFILLLLKSLAVFAGPMSELTSTDSISAYIEKSGFNGVVLVGKDKTVIYKRAFGYRNLESKTPLLINDRFQIGSNTKQFVAASILKLQEAGKLSIDDPVIQYLPQYKNKISADIKIKDVLNHTSGLSNFTDHEEFWQNLDPNKTLTLDDIIDFTLKFPLDFEPRTKWNYSNSGYVIAGKIIEEVSGESWDQFIKENFLVPLNMNDTGYAEHFENASEVYAHIKDKGQLVPFIGFNLSWALSAGGLYSTVDDLFKWTAIYSDSKLLSDESIKDMQTPFKENYGLGLKILPFRKDLNINHDGRTPGFVSQISWLKNAHLSVIKLDNIDGKVPGISELLMNFFMYGKVQIVKQDKLDLPKEKLQEYVGIYKFENFEFNLFIKDDKLFLKTNDSKQPPYELVANDTDSFNLLDVAGEEFVRDGSGKITGLNHYQNGHVSQFNRK